MSFLLIFLKTARKIAPREAADLSSARFTPRSPCLELLPGVGRWYLIAPFKSDSFCPGQQQLRDLAGELCSYAEQGETCKPTSLRIILPVLS